MNLYDLMKFFLMTARNIIVSFLQKNTMKWDREWKRAQKSMNIQGWLGNNTQINKDVWL